MMLNPFACPRGDDGVAANACLLAAATPSPRHLCSLMMTLISGCVILDDVSVATESSSMFSAPSASALSIIIHLRARVLVSRHLCSLIEFVDLIVDIPLILAVSETGRNALHFAHRASPPASRC